MLLAASGGGAAADSLYVDDVFSTYLYDGTEANKTITNGIDLAGEGGMVWIKARTDTRSHFIFDTERGVQKRLITNGTFSEATATNSLTQFNNNGFNLGDYGDTNKSGQDMCAWSFRKAPGFFQAVKYTSNSNTSVTIPHGLGSVPGMVWIKNASRSSDWMVWHRSLGSNGMRLNSPDAGFPNANIEYSAPDATNFYAKNPGYDGNAVTASGNNDEYIAYFFAHDDASFGTNEDESIIKCGNYMGNGGVKSIDLGFEPQWIMIKSTDFNNNAWLMFDTMRGIANNANDAYLLANANYLEENFQFLNVTSTGFDIKTNASHVNTSGYDYIYMAIRRPHKPPEAATEVFKAFRGTTDAYTTLYTSGFPVDLVFQKNAGGGGFGTYTWSRIAGSQNYLDFNEDQAESGGRDTVIDSNTQFSGFAGLGNVAGEKSFFAFKRAPGFFDIVAYTGTGSARTVNHNLEAVPELLIVKSRSASNDWRVYVASRGNTAGLVLNNHIAENTGSTGLWNSTTPTSTNFTVGTFSGVNGSGVTFIAYLFATLPGISKVGSYTGTGNAVNVDCGFSAGARFILIKRTDAAGDWYVYDSLRGIVSGNDPYLLINSTGAEVTNTDYVDPLTSGFTVTSSAPAALNALNATGGSYIFLAIA